MTVTISRMRSVIALTFLAIFATNCAYDGTDTKTAKSYLIGKPYQIKGKWYTPRENLDYDRTGVASWYGAPFHGRKTANGERYNMYAMTAAHPTLPLPTIVSVRNVDNGRRVTVRINDRGPFVRGRIIDLSRKAAERLGIAGKGTALVRVTVLRNATLRLKSELTGRDYSAELDPGTTMALRRSRSTERYRSSRAVAEARPSRRIKRSPERARRARVTTRKSTRRRLRAGTRPRIRPNPSGLASIAPAAGPGRPARLTRSRTKNGVGRRSYYIQVGSYTRRENAVTAGDRLSDVARPHIAVHNINEALYYRLRIGPFKSRRHGYRELERIREMGYPDARVVVR